jgi:hypothetical protein
MIPNHPSDPIAAFSNRLNQQQRFVTIRPAIVSAGGAAIGVACGTIMPVSVIASGPLVGSGIAAAIGGAALAGGAGALIAVAIGSMISKRSSRKKTTSDPESTKAPIRIRVRRDSPEAAARTRNKLSIIRRNAGIGAAVFAATGVQATVAGITGAGLLGIGGVALATGGIGAIAATSAMLVDEIIPSDKRPPDNESATRAFFTSIIQNDLASLPPEIRQAQLDEYQTSTPEAIEHFCRAMIHELIRSPSALTDSNIPEFMIEMLEAIQMLRENYQNLKEEEKNIFTLHSEPGIVNTVDFQNLVRNGRSLSAQLYSDFSDVINWPLLADCSQQITLH